MLRLKRMSNVGLSVNLQWLYKLFFSANCKRIIRAKGTLNPLSPRKILLRIQLIFIITAAFCSFFLSYYELLLVLIP